MPLHKILTILRNSIISLVLGGLFFGAFSFFLLVMTQEKSRATTDILIVQNKEGFSDYFALSKSVDYLSGILIESVYSERFLSEMKNVNAASLAFLPTDKLDRLKDWQKKVSIQKNANAGIISIEVYGDSQQQVLDTSNTLVEVLTKQYAQFIGQGQNIEIKVLSGPLSERNPTVLQLALVSLGGFLLGSVLIFLWLVYREEKKAQKSELSDSFSYATMNLPENHSNGYELVNSSQEKSVLNNDRLSEHSAYWQERLKQNLP